MRDLLIKRLTSLRAKARVVDLLKRAKDAGGKQARRAFRVSGSVEDLSEALRQAFDLNLLTLGDIAEEVDLIEENGAQHIFLATMSAQGHEYLTAARFGDAFPAIPDNPTAGFYGDLPHRRTYFSSHVGGWLLVKQVCTETYEEPESAVDDDGQRVTRYVSYSTRAIHLLRVHPESGNVEIRLDRVAPRDDALAMGLLDKFLASLSEVLDEERDLVPVAFWGGFPSILAARDETFMSVDEARDHIATHRMSNRRAGVKGMDIRDHPDYHMSGPGYTRDRLAVYWLLNQDGNTDGPSVHTIMRRMTRDDRHIGKVYVAARLLPEELDLVLGRIRHFAG